MVNIFIMHHIVARVKHFKTFVHYLNLVAMVTMHGLWLAKHRCRPNSKRKKKKKKKKGLHSFVQMSFFKSVPIFRSQRLFVFDTILGLIYPYIYTTSTASIYIFTIIGLCVTKLYLYYHRARQNICTYLENRKCLNIILGDMYIKQIQTHHVSFSSIACKWRPN